MLFSAELPWCYFVQKQKFSEWPENQRRLFLEYIKNNGKKIHIRGPTPCPQGWGAHLPPWARPCLMGPLTLHQPQLQLHIFTFGEKKNQREGFIVFYDTEPPSSPNPSREGWSGVRSGSREGNPSPSSPSTFLHHQFHDANRRAWVIPS